MEPIDLLLIGDAADGPLDDVTRIRTLEHAFRLFGGYVYERTTLASGATTHTLATTPWGNSVQVLYEDSDGAFSPRKLHELTVSGAVLTFSAPGETLPNTVFQILREPGPTSLLKGVAAVFDTELPIHVLRVGGATVATSAPSGGFQFHARFPGSRYNGTIVVVSGGVVTLTPAAGTGRIDRFTPTSDRALQTRLRDEIARGRQSVYLTGPTLPGSLTLPSGTYTLTGGTDGTSTAAGLEDFFRQYGLSGVDVICPVGLLTTELESAGLYTALENEPYPVLIVAQAPTSGVALSGVINTHRNQVSVAFKTKYNAGDARERIDDAAPLAAALIASRNFRVTHAPWPAGTPEPRYDPAGLTAVTSGGHLAAYYSIANGWALWHAGTGDAEWPVSAYRAYQEVARAAFTVLQPTIGRTFADLSGIQTLLGTAFQALRHSEMRDWNVVLVGSTLYCDLWFRPHGEIRTISARVALGRSEYPIG